MMNESLKENKREESKSKKEKQIMLTFGMLNHIKQLHFSIYSNLSNINIFHIIQCTTKK